MCFKSYATDTIHSIHMGKVHKVRPYDCQKCDYKAARKSHMSSHMEFKHPADPSLKKKVPPRPKRFKCSQCEYRAASKVRLRVKLNRREPTQVKYILT